MAELKAGDAVKIDYKAKRYGPIFYIEDIRNDIAALYQLSSPRVGQGQKVHEQKVAVERLTQVCREVTWSGYSSSVCGRAVKEGKLCGIHAGARKRVATNREKERIEAERLARIRQATSKRRKELEDKLRDRGWLEFVKVRDANAGTVELRFDDLVDISRNA